MGDETGARGAQEGRKLELGGSIPAGSINRRLLTATIADLVDGARQRQIYTDPGCPFGFNAQRQEGQLLWHYGEGLNIRRTMIVLTEKSSSFEELGVTREMVAGNARRLRSSYGMPMLTEAPNRLAATIQASSAYVGAYVGARIHDPARADLLLRHLRRRAFSEGKPLDEL